MPQYKLQAIHWDWSEAGILDNSISVLGSRLCLYFKYHFSFARRSSRAPMPTAATVVRCYGIPVPTAACAVGSAILRTQISQHIPRAPRDVLDSSCFSKQHCPQQLLLQAEELQSIAPQLLLWAAASNSIFWKQRNGI
jgi:hypothetical protein